MSTTSAGLSIPGVAHRTIDVGGASIHLVTAGDAGSPVLLVHGFPETWWAFRHVVPLLARAHRVVAVDLRGFGDSAPAEEGYGSEAAARDLHELVAALGTGPVHLVAQDLSGAAVLRLAATHPEDVLSLTAIELGLAGFGLEALGDVTHGGSWHIGALATPGIPELLLTGRERELLGWVHDVMTVVPGAVTEADLDEFARTYARPGGWRGAAGLYRSVLTEGAELRALAERSPLTMPVLAIGAGGGSFTADTMRQVTAREVEAVQLDGVGHHAAQEAPTEVADAVLAFTARLDATL